MPKKAKVPTSKAIDKLKIAIMTPTEKPVKVKVKKCKAKKK